MFDDGATQPGLVSGEVLTVYSFLLRLRYLDPLPFSFLHLIFLDIRSPPPRQDFPDPSHGRAWAAEDAARRTLLDTDSPLRTRLLALVRLLRLQLVRTARRSLQRLSRVVPSGLVGSLSSGLNSLVGLTGLGGIGSTLGGIGLGSLASLGGLATLAGLFLQLALTVYLALKLLRGLRWLASALLGGMAAVKRMVAAVIRRRVLAFLAGGSATGLGPSITYISTKRTSKPLWALSDDALLNSLAARETALAISTATDDIGKLLSSSSSSQDAALVWILQQANDGGRASRIVRC